VLHANCRHCRVESVARFSQCVAVCCRVLQGVLEYSGVLTVAFPGDGYMRLWYCCMPTVDTASWKPLHCLGASPRKFVEVWPSWQMWGLRPHRVPEIHGMLYHSFCHSLGLFPRMHCIIIGLFPKEGRFVESDLGLPARWVSPLESSLIWKSRRINPSHF